MFDITTKVQVTSEMVADLVVTAFEGGSNYWIEKVEYVMTPGGAMYDPPYYANKEFYEQPFKLVIVDNEDRERHELTPETVAKGLQLLADKYYANHWRDLVDDNSDADTADVFLQLCLFGEVVFG